MHLVAYLKTGPTASYASAWRHPAAPLDDIWDPERYEHVARVLEEARFDAAFFADGLGLPDLYRNSFADFIGRGGQTSLLDPMTVLPLMARVTRHLGLGNTISTTFYPPFQIARSLGSLDLLSRGRAAWNVVTSATDYEARNFGMDGVPPKAERYDRADDVLEACCALWDCWDADAMVMDRASGVFADASKIRYADHVGPYVRTRGPLSIPRSPQGHPVIMQAGSSDRGRDFAARWAEVIFTIQRGQAEMMEFYTDIKTRMDKRGRRPEECAILPSVSVVLGETESIARERAAYLDSLIDPELNRAATSSNLGADITKVKEGVTLASLQGNQGMKGSEDVLTQHMKAEKLTFAQVAENRGRGREIVGTAEMVADRLQEVFESGACDGFVVSPVNHPGMFEQFCRSVVPELQRRGLFRKEYTGRTLRENLRS